MKCINMSIVYWLYNFLIILEIKVAVITQLALRRWPNVGIGRHRRDR